MDTLLISPFLLLAITSLAFKTIQWFKVVIASCVLFSKQVTAMLKKIIKMVSKFSFEYQVY